MATEQSENTEVVPAKQIWIHEAHEFTPWLAKNLPLLGETLGMEIKLVQQEAACGRYNVDILADDARTGAAIVIENQLEWTNHSHLGQILTYAGWQDARTLIWVAPRFHEEHRAALDWINRWTSKDIEVFGVELHTTPNGDSEANVELVPVVFPESWTKSDGSKPIPVRMQSVVLREFFQQLIDDLHKKDSQGFPHDKARSAIFHSFPSGVSEITYRASFESGLVWVYIPGWQPDNNRILNEIRNDAGKRAKVEAELNLPPDTDIDWRTAARSLGVYRKGSLNDSEEELEEIRQWMFDYLLKFRDVFNPRMEAIIEEMENSG